MLLFTFKVLYTTLTSSRNLELHNFIDGNLHPQAGIVNEEERGRKREKNIKKRRKARVCIVVDYLNSHLACSRLQEGGGNG